MPSGAVDDGSSKPPARDWLAIGGLGLALVAGLARLTSVNMELMVSPAPGDLLPQFMHLFSPYLATPYSVGVAAILYVIAVVAALAALAKRRPRRFLLPALLGAWLTAIPGLIRDIVNIAAYSPLDPAHYFGEDIRNTSTFMVGSLPGEPPRVFTAGLLGDLAGTAAVVILFLALRKPFPLRKLFSLRRLFAPRASREPGTRPQAPRPRPFRARALRLRPLRPRAFPVLLLSLVVLAMVIGAIPQIAALHVTNPYVINYGSGNATAATYPSIALPIANVVAAAASAVLVLRLELVSGSASASSSTPAPHSMPAPNSRLAGGALLIGWTVAQILALWSWATDAWTFSGWETALNLVAALLLLTTLVLAVRHARRPALSAARGSRPTKPPATADASTPTPGRQR